MKKNITFITLFFFILLSACCKKNDFIKIDSVQTVIGNDKFMVKQKAFTGIAGEENEEIVKYFRKEHTVYLTSYDIKKYLVTYGEFQEFLAESGYKTLYEREKSFEYKKELTVYNHPVKRISLLDAIAYCQWYSDKNAEVYRLPTSAEWEYAALGNTKRIFPWGDESMILPSTNTDSLIGRENFSVFEITEDVSPLGMANLMGGVEYTLDCYDSRFYENSPSINPVCLIPYNALSLMRGIHDYNNLENDVFGLYDWTWNGIDEYYGYSYFRLVKDSGTIFNRDSLDEAVYSPKIGIADKVKLYTHPKKMKTFSEYKCESDVYILFESKEKDFYRCFIQTSEINLLGNLMKTWKVGWVEASEINMTTRKWYER